MTTGDEQGRQGLAADERRPGTPWWKRLWDVANLPLPAQILGGFLLLIIVTVLAVGGINLSDDRGGGNGAGQPPGSVAFNPAASAAKG